jgi:hypothetical protein
MRGLLGIPQRVPLHYLLPLNRTHGSSSQFMVV